MFWLHTRLTKRLMCKAMDGISTRAHWKLCLMSPQPSKSTLYPNVDKIWAHHCSLISNHVHFPTLWSPIPSLKHTPLCTNGSSRNSLCPWIELALLTCCHRSGSDPSDEAWVSLQGWAEEVFGQGTCWDKGSKGHFCQQSCWYSHLQWGIWGYDWLRSFWWLCWLNKSMFFFKFFR